MLEMLIHRVLQGKFGPHSVNNNGGHSVDHYISGIDIYYHGSTGTRFAFYTRKRMACLAYILKTVHLTTSEKHRNPFEIAAKTTRIETQITLLAIYK